MSPSFQFNDRMYTNKIMRKWDNVNQREVNDTIYGFYNVYDWRMSVSANTTLYGFYKPWRKLFGDGIIAIRHMMKPNISFTYAPLTSRPTATVTYQPLPTRRSPTECSVILQEAKQEVYR